jgi:hypothetical protein
VGDERAVLPWEKRMDTGEREEATRVSASDVLVDVECLAFLDSSGLETRALRVCWDASNFATVSETRDPLRSNEYPGFLRGGSM